MPNQPRILLGESDQKQALSIAAAFRQQGWETVSASDAVMVQSVALKTRPDAVVLNAQLHGGGGLAALRRIRSSVHTAAIPVVAVGGKSAAQKQDFLKAGAQEYLDLPFDDASLCAAVRENLSRPDVVSEAPSEVLRDAARLAALKASGLLDTPEEKMFDRVTQLVSKVLGTPTALLSLVDKDRQFFKSQVGLSQPWAAARQTPLSHSFCQWVVSGREQVAIDDAREHPVLRTNLAIRDLGVIAYAGVPVCSAQGQALGSLCAIDSKPRVWKDHDMVTLADFTRLVECCAARSELGRQQPASVADLDRYVEAAGAGITGAVRILRRQSSTLGQAERDLLLEMIEEFGGHLVQLNRLIQVAKAIQ